MKKLLIVFFAIVLCTGCNLSNTAGDGISDGAVSGSAVSGSAADAEKGSVKNQAGKDTANEGKNCLANDDNEYRLGESYDEWGCCLVQTCLDGSQAKRIHIKNLRHLCWVNNEWVYYISQDSSSSKEVICRIPIRKTKQRDTLLLKETETLTSEDSLSDGFYVTDTYIIYCADEEEDRGGVYKLDLQSRQKETLLLDETKDAAYMEILYNENSPTDDYPIMSAGKLFVTNIVCSSVPDQDQLWSLDLETGETRLLASGESFTGGITQGEIWFIDLQTCNWYDEEKEEIVRVLSAEKVVEFLKREGVWKKKFDKCFAEEDLWVEMTEFSYGRVQYYGGRFYISVVVETESYEHTPAALLSVSAQNPEDIHNETAASDFLSDRHNSGDEFYSMTMRDGKMLLYLIDDDSDEIFVIYDLETKEIQEISEKQAEKLFPECE